MSGIAAMMLTGEWVRAESASAAWAGSLGLAALRWRQFLCHLSPDPAPSTHLSAWRRGTFFTRALPQNNGTDRP
jgi:hypothetical protein